MFDLSTCFKIGIFRKSSFRKVVFHECHVLENIELLVLISYNKL